MALTHHKPNGGRLRFHQFAQAMNMQFCARGFDYAGQRRYFVQVEGYTLRALFIRGLLATAKGMDYTRRTLLHYFG